MKKIFLLFPHQLFEEIELLKTCHEVYLIEETLFFKQYCFHKQKLVLHRASMKSYAAYLQENLIRVKYIDATTKQADIRSLIPGLQHSEIHYYDVCDQWLESRIIRSCAQTDIPCIQHSTPSFINSRGELNEYFGKRESYFQTEFYIRQRKRLNLLITKDEKPIFGKWSFDSDNRKKWPTGKQIPTVLFPVENTFVKEAKQYVEAQYPNNPGDLSKPFRYPINHTQAQTWMHAFFENRFSEFGFYEDAIVGEESYLNHSVLTPLLNIGLIVPLQVIEAAITYSENHQIPINSLEGFIRQIIGWREFIRGVYLYSGVKQRTRNFWDFKKSVPESFYRGNTGIIPVDRSIKKLLATAYNHHIERLMIIGNFMLLNEYHPDAVYRWFMEMYIDAYDWVMVPNVYGMSQFADGGMMSTKPYISGSNYVIKMSDYKKGPWCEIWDALFWNFLDKHRVVFSKNKRMSMLLSTYNRMPLERKAAMRQVAAVLPY